MTLHVTLPTFAYGRRRMASQRWCLEACEFTLPQGNHAVVGVNGAGKSTLLALLAGVLPGATTIRVDGVELGSAARRGRQRHLGYLPQLDGLPKHMSISDAVSYAAWLKGMSGLDGKRAVERALEVTNLVEWAGHRCSRLSGGTARRAGLACAVVHRPDVLLLDEPTAGLDPLQRESFNALLAESRFAPYVLLATHLSEDVTSVADEVLVLAKGTLRMQTTVVAAAGEGRSPAAFTHFLRRELTQ